MKKKKKVDIAELGEILELGLLQICKTKKWKYLHKGARLLENWFILPT